ncbi:MAG: hypothetical protein C4589_10050 [Peptococcaceae bacterium]|nr:MAG: hypothetical protein C4589_10050 [Peptococcaceae bacterium]
MGVQDRDWYRDWWKEFDRKEREKNRRNLNDIPLDDMIGGFSSSSSFAKDIFIFLFGVILGVLATMKYFDII